MNRLLAELKLEDGWPVELRRDNQAAISIAKNPVHYHLTKHIEVDRHFISEMIENEVIDIIYVPTPITTDILTKALHIPSFENLCSKLGMINIYDPTWGGKLKFK